MYNKISIGGPFVGGPFVGGLFVGGLFVGGPFVGGLLYFQAYIIFWVLNFLLTFTSLLRLVCSWSSFQYIKYVNQ